MSRLHFLESREGDRERQARESKGEREREREREREWGETRRGQSVIPSLVWL